MYAPVADDDAAGEKKKEDGGRGGLGRRRGSGEVPYEKALSMAGTGACWLVDLLVCFSLPLHIVFLASSYSPPPSPKPTPRQAPSSG